ncbi:hypothetical protein JCM33374_g5613 [Metschnikowia sp. JCM 33374]|nr:hypothetical protein JCM33374_g5613 [Metschnikowia sp. JCM 33374]
MSDTSSVEHVLTEDPMEPFRSYCFQRKSWLDVGPSRTYQFKTAPVAPQQVIEPFPYKDFVPYKLDWEKLNLFPEFISILREPFLKPRWRIKHTACMTWIHFVHFGLDQQRKLQLPLVLLKMTLS